MAVSCIHSGHPAGCCPGSYEPCGCGTSDLRHRDDPVAGARPQGEDGPVRDGQDSPTLIRSGASPDSEGLSLSGIRTLAVSECRRWQRRVSRDRGWLAPSSGCSPNRGVRVRHRRAPSIGEIGAVERVRATDVVCSTACARQMLSMPTPVRCSCSLRRRPGRRVEPVRVGSQHRTRTCSRKRGLSGTGSSGSTHPRDGTPGLGGDRADASLAAEAVSQGRGRVPPAIVLVPNEPGFVSEIGEVREPRRPAHGRPR